MNLNLSFYLNEGGDQQGEKGLLDLLELLSHSTTTPERDKSAVEEGPRIRQSDAASECPYQYLVTVTRDEAELLMGEKVDRNTAFLDDPEGRFMLPVEALRAMLEHEELELVDVVLEAIEERDEQFFEEYD